MESSTTFLVCFQIPSSLQIQEKSGGIFTKISCEKRIQAWVKKFELYGTVESHSGKTKLSHHGLESFFEENGATATINSERYFGVTREDLHRAPGPLSKLYEAHLVLARQGRSQDV